MTAILIVGGAGFIGSHTAKAAAEAGLAPVVFDNLSSGHEWALRWGVFERGDLADQASIVAAIRRHDVKAVVQFRGREIAHSELGKKLLVRFAEDLAQYGEVESSPRMEGRNAHILISPKKSGSGKAN